MTWRSVADPVSPRPSAKAMGHGRHDAVGHTSPQPNQPHPVSRTYQYRKVMKPLLERKRRARINRCLDELKELMVVALQSEGENVAKLEKADILELTVRHLQRLKRNDQEEADRYREGFAKCASEVESYLGTGTGGSRLLDDLGECLKMRGVPPEGDRQDRRSDESVWRPW